MIYNINLGIGWASSGVEYAQLYRYQLFNQLNVDSRFIFMDMFTSENIIAFTDNIGFKKEDVIWLYQSFTDIPLEKCTLSIDWFIDQWNDEIESIEKSDKSYRFLLKKNKWVTCFFSKGTDKVHRVEYVSNGKLIRKDYYSSTRVFSEYYYPENNRAQMYLRRFYNLDGSVAFEQSIHGENHLFKFKDRILYSKEELIRYFIQRMQLSKEDIVILDRGTGLAQAFFQNHAPAKLGVVVHAEHFSEQAMNKNKILWNNFYEYQFKNAKYVDFFVTATKSQKELLKKQFKQYYNQDVCVYDIPVGSLNEIKEDKRRKNQSLITASRLAPEKHVDWLVEAVIQAKEQLPSLKFDIYGQGKEEAKIQSIIDQHQAQKYIRLMGHKDLSEVYTDYQVYISSSLSEGFGLTLMEAIGSGLALIGFDVRYGNQTFIENEKNGYLLEFNDNMEKEQIIDSLSQAIIKLYKKKKRKSFSNHSYVLAQQFVSEAVGTKWKTLIEEVIG